MRHSLRTRWMLVLIAAALAEAVLVAWAMQVSTARAFEVFVTEEMVNGFGAEMADLYRNVGRLDGMLAAHQRGGPPPGGRRPQRPPRPEATDELRFQFTDVAGTVIVGPEAGQMVSAERLAAGAPIYVDGEQIGVALMPANLGALGAAEARFLAASRAGVIWALAGALLLAVVLGVFVARTTVQPLARLTTATQAIADGAFDQVVQVQRRDEVGQLAEAFNTMTMRLREARALREQMTADLAHDLRTPLTVLTGTLEALRDGVLQSTPERIASLHTEAQTLGRLIDDLHLLALADAGELTLHRSVKPLADLLSYTAERFKPIALAEGIHLTVNDPGQGLAVRVDAGQMQRVLGNLVANAIRHTPSGGRITLSAAHDGEAVVVRVADTGEGIVPELAARIFERTVRGDHARHTDGAGLGLAIAQSIAQAHGGQLDVASAPGEGATFSMRLPEA
ncbi:MAG: HAMP domain-containing sensor histidine kinase [Bacteroidota bacterium]